MKKNIGLFASLNHLEEINGIRLDLTSRSRAFMLSNLRPDGNDALDQFMALSSPLKILSMHAIELKPKNPHSRWVALDARNQIIAEGKNPEAVERKAVQLTDVYFLMYLPKKGLIYFL